MSISVAVLKEAGLLDSKEGVSILGAAVADDVIGVILLSVMCTLVNTGSVDVAGLGLILLKQVLFFVAAAVVVVWVAPALMTLAGVLKAPSGIAVMAVIICLAMAWALESAGLELRGGRRFSAGIAVSKQRLRGGRGPVYRAGWRHVVRAGVLRGHRPADHRRG